MRSNERPATSDQQRVTGNELRVVQVSRVRLNPYVSLLQEGIQLAVPDVRVAVSPVLSPWRWLSPSLPHILHLHWPELLYRTSQPWRSQALWRYVVLSLALAQRLGIRVVYTLHNLRPHELALGDLDAQAAAHMVATADAVHVHHISAAQAVADTYGRRDGIYVVPHGHYIGAYPDEMNPATARARLGLAPDQFVYLYFGQIRRYKGLERLLTAFRQVQDPRCTLLIAGHVGDPAYAAHIRPLAAQDTRVRLRLGYVPSDQVQVYMRAADICVLPYRHVTTSGAAMLAFSFGQPIIAPRLGPFLELVGESRGLLYEADEGEMTLVAALRRARQSDLSSARAEALAYARRHNWKRLGKQHVAVYRRLLAGHP